MVLLVAMLVQLCCVFILGTNITLGQEGFRFANHLTDHLVLQRAPQRAKIWGYRSQEAPVQLVLISCADPEADCDREILTIEYDSSVQWSAIVPPKPAGGPFVLVASSTIGSEVLNIQLSDVMFGDVWLCGGQSNMQFSVDLAFKAKDELKIADNYPNIRLFTTQRYATTTPVQEIEKKNILQPWSVASSSSVGGGGWNYFSAVCWMFGRRLYDRYKIPIGLLSTNYGGTPVEAWSSPDALRTCNITERSEFVERAPRGKKFSPINGPGQHSVLWNAMISPFLNTTIYGAIWYQGENNWDKNTEQYGCMFAAMISDWRAKWFSGSDGARAFPFGFVQLGTLGIPMKFEPGRAAAFPLIRWLQTDGYGFAPNPKMPKTFMAISIDLPDNTSPQGPIHPRDKTTVADRLILGARNVAYGESDVVFAAPFPTAWKSTGQVQDGMLKVNIYFESDTLLHLVVPTGFQIYLQYGTPAKQVLVDAEICKCGVDSVEQVVCACASVTERGFNVMAVLYNWNQQPCKYKTCALYAGDLPVPPFILTSKQRIA